jgi:electron transfer flavoprotein alpha subunit
VARIVDLRVEPSNVEIGRRALGVVRDALERVDLANAEIVVAGGRGLGNKENFKIIEDLARAVGGVVGGTRPVIDAGWLPREHQIGISGQSVAPKLYIACAISGAPQHLVGTRAARCIVAINTDPRAPIFGVADYGIVGDVFRIVPALIASAQGTCGPAVQGGAES